MCVIVSQPPTKYITDEVIGRCSRSNKDGCGMMWAEDGHLFMFRTLEPKELIEKYNRVRRETGGDELHIFLHFRARSHGKINLDNCHPFKLENEEFGFMHNGIFSGISPRKDEGMSDSWWFVKSVMDCLPDRWHTMPKVVKLIDDYARSGYNKFVLLHKDGWYGIFNASMGTVQPDGCWYSCSGEYFYNGKSYTQRLSFPTLPWKNGGNTTYDKCSQCRTKIGCKTSDLGNFWCKKCCDASDPGLWNGIYTLVEL